MAGDPGDQIPLVLLGKLHDGGILVDGTPDLFQPLVRLPFHRFIGEHHGTPFGDIGEEFAHLVPLRLGHFKQIHLVHLDKGMLRHHGHALHRIAELLQGEILVIEPVGIEGFGQLIQKNFPQLAQIMLQKEDFLTMEDVQPLGLLVFDMLLQHSEAVGPFIILFCHGVSPPEDQISM